MAVHTRTYPTAGLRPALRDPPDGAELAEEPAGEGAGLADEEHGGSCGGMSQMNRITLNPDQCSGRPCIRGMRIRVKDVLDMLAAGATEAEILESYPHLEREDIQAALEYAARQVDPAVLSLVQ